MKECTGMVHLGRPKFNEEVRQILKIDGIDQLMVFVTHGNGDLTGTTRLVTNLLRSEPIRILVHLCADTVKGADIGPILIGFAGG